SSSTASRAELRPIIRSKRRSFQSCLPDPSCCKVPTGEPLAYLTSLPNLRAEELPDTCASSVLLSHSFGVRSPVKLMEGMKFVTLMAFTPVLPCHSHRIAFRIWPYADAAHPQLLRFGCSCPHSHLIFFV